MLNCIPPSYFFCLLTVIMFTDVCEFGSFISSDSSCFISSSGTTGSYYYLAKSEGVAKMSIFLRFLF